ncbi:MAG: EamA family transporter [Phycisphaeraceae bacterium]|nr:EamA family transporter [Phycisphaerae bacterium]MBX3393379.1 EamA family transporter [Phycisphaeraceae bacterium]
MNTDQSGTREAADVLNPRVGPLLVVISSISFGLLPLFSMWSESGGGAVEMRLGLRFLIGAMLLTGLALRERAPWPGGGRLAGLVVLGAGVYSAQSFCFFTALDRGTPSGLVSLLLYLYPVSVTLGAWLILRERLSASRWIAVALAMAGLVLTVWPMVSVMGRADGSGSTAIPGGMVGIGLGLFSGMAYAVYILVASRVVTRRTALTATAVVCWSAAAVFIGVAASRGHSLPSTVLGWTGVLALGVVGTAVAMGCFLAGSAWIGPVRASTISILEPVTTVVIGSLLLGEGFAAVQLAGGALILSGALMAGLPPGRSGRDGA